MYSFIMVKKGKPKIIGNLSIRYIFLWITMNEAKYQYQQYYTVASKLWCISAYHHKSLVLLSASTEYLRVRYVVKSLFFLVNVGHFSLCVYTGFPWFQLFLDAMQRRIFMPFLPRLMPMPTTSLLCFLIPFSPLKFLDIFNSCNFLIYLLHISVLLSILTSLYPSIHPFLPHNRENVYNESNETSSSCCSKNCR